MFSYVSLVLIYFTSSKNKVQMRCSEYKKDSVEQVDIPILLTKKYFGFILNMIKINKLF